MSEDDRDDGWPSLPRRPASSAAAAASWIHIVDALQWLRGAILALEEAVERLAERVDAYGRRGRDERRDTGRRPYPSLSDLDPELTPGGGIHLSQEQFHEMQNRMAQLEIQRARAEGAESALKDVKQERAATARTLDRRLKVSMPILLALVSGLVGALVHFLKL